MNVSSTEGKNLAEKHAEIRFDPKLTEHTKLSNILRTSFPFEASRRDRSYVIFARNAFETSERLEDLTRKRLERATILIFDVSYRKV